MPTETETNTKRTRAPRIRQADIVELLAGERVLAAARKLLEARIGRELAFRSVDEDTATNGQPRANAIARGDHEAREALEQLYAEIDRTSKRIAREAMQR